MPDSGKIDLTPPQDVADAAAHGLALRRAFNRGGTDVGIARARDLSNRRTLSSGTIGRMVSYFRRHAVDREARNFGNDDDPSAGYVAWLLWGGDAGRDWAEKMAERLDSA